MFRTPDTEAKTEGARVLCLLFLGVEASSLSDFLSDSTIRQNTAGALHAGHRPKRCDGTCENDPEVVDLVLALKLTGLLFGDNVIRRTSTRRFCGERDHVMMVVNRIERWDHS